LTFEADLKVTVQTCSTVGKDSGISLLKLYMLKRLLSTYSNAICALDEGDVPDSQLIYITRYIDNVCATHSLVTPAFGKLVSNTVKNCKERQEYCNQLAFLLLSFGYPGVFEMNVVEKQLLYFATEPVLLKTKTSIFSDGSTIKIIEEG
jgi:hypothetical protein